jgi:hypothetical protein
VNKRHTWIMLFCCLLLIVGLATIFLFNIPVTSMIYFGLILLCPIAHFFMMGSMHDNNSQTHDAPAHVEIADKN